MYLLIEKHFTFPGGLRITIIFLIQNKTIHYNSFPNKQGFHCHLTVKMKGFSL